MRQDSAAYPPAEGGRSPQVPDPDDGMGPPVKPWWRPWWRRQQFRPSPVSVFFNPSFLLRRRLHTALADRLRHSTGVVLDIGCGSKPYKDLSDASVYIGIEVKQSGHGHALEPIDVYYDGLSIPVADQSCDLVLCSEVLEHVAEPTALLREIRRVLRPGGHLVLTVPFAWGEHERPYDERRWTWYGLNRVVSTAGYDDMEIERVGHHLEAIFQLLAAYVHQRLLPRHKLINALLVPFTVTPILLTGWLLTLLPNQDNLYMNLVARVRRPMA